MGLTVVTDSKKTFTWNDNPYDNETYAIVDGTEITELVVQDQNGVSILYTKDTAMLSHLIIVLTQLLAEIPAP